jgi:hypothetical protein
MNKIESCKHGKSAPQSILKNLHHSQAGSGRHKCTVCAYDEGLSNGVLERMGIATEFLKNYKEVDFEECEGGSLAPQQKICQLPDSQARTGRHKCTICAYQEGYNYGVSQRSIDPQNIPPAISIAIKPFPDVDEENITVKEGIRRWFLHLRRERNAKIVSAKKAYVLKTTGVLRCEICGFDFKERYGKVGEGFCEAHHKKPLSTLNQETKTRLEDLAILCSNCHRMIHRTKPMMSVEEFKKTLDKE